MLRKTLFGLVTIVLLFNIIAGMVPAATQGPVVWAEDFEINVYGWPSEVVAGKGFEFTISTGSESAGPAANELVEFWPSMGGTTTAAVRLDTTGSVTVTAVYTRAGSASLTVSVGTDEVFTYTVRAGDCLQNIAEQFGDRFPAIWERNKAVVGDDPSRLSSGQVLDVVRYAPSRTLGTTVLAAEPAEVEWLDNLLASAGEKPVVNGQVLDQFGNPVVESVALTVTLGSETFVVTADPGFTVQATKVYTQAEWIAVGAEPLLSISPGYRISCAQLAKLSVSGPTEAVADSTITLTAKLTDEYENPVPNQEVTFQGELTATTEANGWTPFFAYSVPTQTGRVNLVFEAAGLKATHALTVTPAAVHEVTATVEADGRIAVYSFDEFGNPRVGDEVDVSIDYNGGIDLKTTTVVPPDPESAVAPAVVAAPAAPAVGGPVAKEYTVQAGDSLWKIWTLLGQPGEWTNNEGTGWRQLAMDENGLEYNEAGIVVIMPGQILTLPAAP